MNRTRLFVTLELKLQIQQRKFYVQVKENEEVMQTSGKVNTKLNSMIIWESNSESVGSNM